MIRPFQYIVSLHPLAFGSAYVPSRALVSLFPYYMLLCYLVLSSSVSLAADARKVVIPFDFVSTFDDGHTGQIVGDMIWKKLSREKSFIVPESMLEVRDYCDSHKLRPTPTMALDKMKKIVVGDFEGHIGIWGSVERAAGTDGEIYDIVLKCVDFSAKPQPKVIYEAKARTNSVSEIPHLYVKQLLAALAGRKSGGQSDSALTVDDGWQKSKNLVSGDFEHGVGAVPKGWEKVAGQQREPLGGLVRWTTEKGKASNHVVRFALDRNVAENEGVMYYSDYFPVEEGATYRFQCRWRSNAPAVKVFVKCYDVDESGRRREVYRSQQNVQGPNGQWNTQTEDFTPKHPKYVPKWGRVMLFAYLSPGEAEFDDVIVKQISPGSPGQDAKVRRPSSASKITVKEIEEGERRSRETKDGKK
jgi:hypothetical protein